MANLGLDDSLVRVKTTILENPSSEATRKSVEREMQDVLKTTQQLQSYSEREALSLMQLTIISVGYARNRIDNFQTLSALSSVVPSSFGMNILFPVVEEDGRHRLWYYSDVVSDVETAAAVDGKSAAYALLLKFGRYSFFIAGLMPDVLKRGTRKKGVDVAYYDRTGSLAFKSAATTQAAENADASTLEELASGFPHFRMVLNEAGALIGTAARQTRVDNILARYGINGDYIMPRGPLKERNEKERWKDYEIGGLSID